MDIRGVCKKGVDWMYLAQDKNHWWGLVNTVINHQVPQKAVNFLISYVNIISSRRSLLHGVR